MGIIKITSCRRQLSEKERVARIIQRAREIKAERLGLAGKKVLPWRK